MSDLPGPDEIAKLIAPEDNDQAYVLALMPIIGDFVRLAQLATNGNVEAVRRLVDNPRDFYANLFKENRTALMGYMMVRSLHEYLSKESKRDPLEHGKFLLELMKYNDQIEAIRDPDRIDGNNEAETAVDQLIRRMDQTRSATKK